MKKTGGEPKDKNKADIINDPAMQVIYDKLKTIENPTDEDVRRISLEMATESNKQVAIAGKTEHSLTAILPLTDLERLRRLAVFFEVEEDIEGLDKAALIDRLIPAIKNSNKLENIIYMLPVEMWEMFIKLYDECCITDNNLIAVRYSVLLGLGYIYLFYDDGNFTYVMPDEIKETYDELDSDSVFSVREFIETLDFYAKAAVHLYGVITMSDYCGLVNGYEEYDEDDMIKPEEVRTWLLNSAKFEGEYHVTGSYIAAADFVKDNGRLKKDVVSALEDMRRGKPRYVPDADTFLDYTDPDYYEITPEIKKLRRVLGREGIAENKIDDLIDSLHFSMAAEEKTGKLIECLNDAGIELEIDRLNILLDDIMAMHNSTRLWSNNGHTPDEMMIRDGGHNRMPREIRFGKGIEDAVNRGDIDPDELIRNADNIAFPNDTLRDSFIGEAKRVKAEKTGRNELCPCGSGKKYKKCCGK